MQDVDGNSVKRTESFGTAVNPSKLHLGAPATTAARQELSEAFLYTRRESNEACHGHAIRCWRTVLYNGLNLQVIKTFDLQQILQPLHAF